MHHHRECPHDIVLPARYSPKQAAPHTSPRNDRYAHEAQLLWSHPRGDDFLNMHMEFSSVALPAACRTGRSRMLLCAQCPLSVVRRWLRRTRKELRVSGRVFTWGYDFNDADVDAQLAYARILEHRRFTATAMYIWPQHDGGDAHASVLFSCPAARSVMFYDPHGMYAPSAGHIHRIVSQLTRSLSGHGWRMCVPTLPGRGAISLQDTLGLCAFYSAFATLIVGANGGEERLLGVMRALHDAPTTAVLNRQFQRFVSDTVWAMHTRHGAGDRVVAMYALEGDADFVYYCARTVVSRDDRERTYTLQDGEGQVRTWGHLHVISRCMFDDRI